MKFKPLIALLMLAALLQTASAENFFTSCRFHYGAGNASGALLNDIDYMTGWAGSGESFNMGSLFTNCKTNNKTPVIISYIIAFTARRDQGLQDCNVGAAKTLCNGGAQYIRDSTERILRQYAKYATGAEQIFGPPNKMIWCMEPDYVQYSGTKLPALTTPEAGAFMNRILDTILVHAPNSVFSMDISPWKDTTFQKTWFTAMNMKRFSFVNTSGGQSTPGSVFISNNQTGCPTWAWIFKTFGTPMIADADYGVAGSATAFITAWQDSATLTARIKDGVIAMCHNQTPAALAPAIEAVRSKIPTPPKCPSGTEVLAPFEMGNVEALNSLSISNGKIEVIDLSGRIVYTKKVAHGNFSFDAWKSGASHMRSGAYIVRLLAGDQSLQKKIFITQ